MAESDKPYYVLNVGPDPDNDQQSAQFYLIEKSSRSFKGANFAEEKTFQVTVDYQPPQLPRQRTRAQTQQQQQQVLLVDLLPRILVLFENLMDYVNQRYQPQDLARIFIKHPDLQKAIIIPPTLLSQLTAQTIMNKIEYVLTSAMKIPFDNDLEINIGVVKLITGQGCRDNMYIVNYEQDRKRKRCIITIPQPRTPDIWCLPRALVVAQAFALGEHCPKAMKKARHLVHRNSTKLLTTQTLKLMEQCHISPEEEGALHHIPCYEQYFQRPICVLSAEVGDQKLYPGDRRWTQAPPLYLYLWRPF